MSDPIQQILTALSTETEFLHHQTNQIIENHAFTAASHENHGADFEDRPRFHWRLKKGKFGIEMYWLERNFIRKDGKWKRFDKHLSLRGKDTYPLQIFRKAPIWEFEAIAEAERDLKIIRKRSRALTKIGRATLRYGKEFK